MTIAHISTAKTWRGGEQQIAYLYEELHQRGIEQIILCPEHSALEDHCMQQGWKCATASSNGSFSLPFARLVARTVRKGQADLLHINDSHAHNNTLLAAILFRLKTPMVLTRRVIFPAGNNIFSRWKYNYKGIKKIICVSNAVREVLSSIIRDTTKMVVIYESIDTVVRHTADVSLRSEFGIPREPFLIGNIASLTPEKDHLTFLRTAARLKGVINSRYLIIGEGDERAKIETAISQMGLAGDVIMTGFRKGAKHLLAELDLLLITSESEGLCTTILDAYLAGVPVVATAAGGIPEILKDEESGLLAAVKDDEMLAKQVLKILDDKALKEKMVSGGKIVLQEHSKSRMAEKTLAVYKEVLEK